MSNFNGGGGHEWLDKAIARFEADYAETSFTHGTKGVQIWVNNHKSAGVQVIATAPGSRDEIYFVENANYYDFVTSGLLYEITDIVTEKLEQYGETESIEDKLSETQKKFYKTSNGKYYGIPHYEGIHGITYDVDLFDKMNLFFDQNGNINKKSTDSGLGLGSDGKAGTSDDGLPATYADFYRLCDTMKKRGVFPLIWSGAYPSYTSCFMAALKTDFEGLENGYLGYTFDGTATKLVDTVSKGVVTYRDPVEITEQNGYEMYASAGNYYALDFMYKVVKNGYYDPKSFNESITHNAAQSTFLLSSFTSAQDIGMIIEGNWWPYEASDTFKQMETRFEGASVDERRLAIMPYPKATEAQIGEKRTLNGISYSLSCINGNVSDEKIELAKTFLQYCETQRSLIEFLETTGIFRGYRFDVPDEVYDRLNYFAKSNVDMMRDSDIVYPYSSSEIFYRNYSAFRTDKVLATPKYTYPIQALQAGMTSEQLFDDVRGKYTRASWNALISK